MNWEAIGAIAEGVGALATIAMLWFLIVQIRQNSLAVKTSSFYQANIQIGEGLTTDVDLARLFTETDWDSCSEAEQMVRINFFAKPFTLFESLFYQHRQGGMEEELWDSRLVHIQFLLQRPTGQIFWEKRRQFYAKSFREFIDEEINSITTSALAGKADLQ